MLAVASLVVNLVVLARRSRCAWTRPHWQLVMQQFTAVGALKPWTILVGFGSSWLAFSGLESISQIAPALQDAAREDRAARDAAGDRLHPDHVAADDGVRDRAAGRLPRQPRSVRLRAGGDVRRPRAIAIAVVITSSTLLLGASNTALIGCYHVFLALVRLGFLPQWLAERNLRFGTPHRAIAISVVVPVVVVLATRGQMELLGDMYSFGLLGAFTLTVGRHRPAARAGTHRGPAFWIGLFTSALVILAWGVNLVEKTKATMFGGSVTLVGFAIAYRRAPGLDWRPPHRVQRGGGRRARRRRAGDRRRGRDAGRGDRR